MSKYQFTIQMRPVAKERARTTTKGGSTWSYTPQRTVMAERNIKDAVSGKGAWFPEHVGIRMTVIIYRDEPDSPTVKRIRQLCTGYKKPNLPVIEPDWDNYGKLVSDALSGTCYVDDGQITNSTVLKRYTKYGEHERVEITLEEDDGI